MRGLLVLAELLRLDVPRIEWAQGCFVGRGGRRHPRIVYAQTDPEEAPHRPDATAQGA